GAHYTSLAQIRAALGLTPGARLDLVTLRTSTLATRLRALPAVDAAATDAAEVRVALPGRLIVTIHERRPIVVWQVGPRGLLVDSGGRLFAEADGAARPALPAVADQRATALALAVGDALDPLAFSAVRKLAAVTPALLGSTAPSLALALTDADGFTLAAPAGWRAVFGLYTTTIRPPSIIDRQVQCLTSLLAQVGERNLATIYLSPGAGACGTYTTRKGTS
ncbi:MAG: cell division protein FtsQ/DivIB, partial [Candidatus Limnocylindrales bacterium]